MKNYRH